MKKIFGVLQKIGKSLMLPVAILPAAGILLGLGNALNNPDLLAVFPALGSGIIPTIASIMEGCGQVIFDNLPLLFSVGVALGLSNGDGVAGLAAIVGFLVMNKSMSIMAGVTPEMTNSPLYANVLGIPSIQTGVFGGILMGIVAANLYNKYYKIELPSYLGFFAGKRFVPIVTAASALIIGMILTLIWPPIQNGLLNFSKVVIDSNLTLAAFLFGVIERALIPFGLHHAFYNPFWYQFGEYTNQAGQLIMGDQSIWFAQLRDGVAFTAGTFMTGKFSFMMFGLPAAALAMIHESKPEKRTYVKSIMISAALTSFLTGITEPIEFAFLFVAPALFGVHCIFAGLSFMLMQLLNVKIGLTFSGGLIDFLLFGVLPNRTSWYLVIVVGLILSVIYYFGFRYMIKKFNLKTPGREDEDEVSISGMTSNSELAFSILESLGNKENLNSLDACITRLRVQVKDINKVDKDRLKALGAAGVMVVGNNIQAIFGPKSDNLKSEINEIISGKTIIKKSKTDDVKNNDSLDKRRKIIESDEKIISLCSGEILDLTKVPDEVFSSKLMGDGFAIKPSDGLIHSPVDGTVEVVFPTKHAIIIKTNAGREVLIHLGIETVKLNGEGFDIFVEVGQKVKAGDKLVKMDLEFIEKNAASLISPVIFTNLGDDESVSIKQGPTTAKEKDRINIIK